MLVVWNWPKPPVDEPELNGPWRCIAAVGSAELNGSKGSCAGNRGDQRGPIIEVQLGPPKAEPEAPPKATPKVKPATAKSAPKAAPNWVPKGPKKGRLRG
jgi:hypothetical protein